MINSISNAVSVPSSSFNSFSTKETSAASATGVYDSQRDKSNISPLRERLTSMIEHFANTEEGAKQLLSTFSKPSNGGLMLGGLPDLTNLDAMARHDRISEKFSLEQQGFERQKNNLVNEGVAAGKSSKAILNDIISLYDAQSELFRLGVGWNGQVFAFNEASTEGFKRTLEHSRDVVNAHA